MIPSDQVPVYAEYLKGELVKGGFKPDDVKIEPAAGSATLTARYAGTDPKKKPILIIDHMDVVEAKASDWTRDPFKPVVENGYVYGRGSVDDKFDVSIVVAVLTKLKREGWKPGRDVILALSGDEETQQQTARNHQGDHGRHHRHRLAPGFGQHIIGDRIRHRTRPLDPREQRQQNQEIGEVEDRQDAADDDVNAFRRLGAEIAKTDADGDKNPEELLGQGTVLR